MFCLRRWSSLSGTLEREYIPKWYNVISFSSDKLESDIEHYVCVGLAKPD